jgi:hypothetical protein
MHPQWITGPRDQAFTLMIGSFSEKLTVFSLNTPYMCSETQEIDDLRRI